MLMIVDLSSSGTNRARRAIMEGQNIPMQPSKRQNARSCTLPSNDIPPTPDSPREEPVHVFKCHN